MDPSPKRTNPTRMGRRESLRRKVRPDMGVLEGMPPQAVQEKSQQKGGEDEEKEKGGGGGAYLQDRDTRSGPTAVPSVWADFHRLVRFPRPGRLDSKDCHHGPCAEF